MVWSPATRLPRSGIEHHVADGEDVGAAPTRPAQKGAQSGEQLLECERLHQVVVRTSVEAGDAVGDGLPGRQHQDGGAVAAGADAARRLETVDVRHHHVEHDHIRALVHDGRQCLGAIASRQHLISLEAKGALDGFTNAAVVFDDQHASGIGLGHEVGVHLVASISPRSRKRVRSL